jgi:hypothetical protein
MGLTNAEIEQFVRDWYGALDEHAPMVDILPMLAEEGLEMQFPEATLRGSVDFEGWYQKVIRIFFDEVHNVKEVGITRDGDDYNLDVVVEWEASVWNPPDAKSSRIMLDASQRWVIRRSPLTGKPVIATYIVDKLDYHEGSAKL